MKIRVFMQTKRPTVATAMNIVRVMSATCFRSATGKYYAGDLALRADAEDRQSYLAGMCYTGLNMMNAILRESKDPNGP